MDFAGHNVHVRRNLPPNGDEKVPKSKVVRSVPLIDQAAAALDGLSRRGYLTGPDDHVFVSATGGPLDDTDMRDGFYAALAAAELGHLRQQEDPIVFHDLRPHLRHLGRSGLAGGGRVGVHGALGIATTMRYVHHVPKHDAAERFSRFVASRTVSPLCPEPLHSEASGRKSEQLRAA